MKISFNIDGLEAIDKLEGVSKDMKFRGGRFALRKAANEIRDEVKRRADRVDDPSSAANISENVAVRWSGRTFKRTGNLHFRVGIMGGAGGNRPTAAYAGLPGGDTRHWRHVEFGTVKTKAQPFMRPALAANIGRATYVFVTEYDKALQRALRREQKKRALKS